MNAQNYTNEKELQVIFDSIPAIVFLKDANNKLIKVNKQFCSILGISKADAEGKQLEDIFGPEMAKMYSENDQKVIQSRESLEFTEYAQDSHGNTLWFQVIKVPHINENNECDGVIGLAVDISSIKSNEYKIRTNEETYKLLVKYANESIVLVNENLEIVLYNDHFTKLFGIDMEGKNISEITDDKKSKNILEYIKNDRSKYIKEEIIISNEKQNILDLHNLISYCPININSHFKGGIFIFNDISERIIKENLIKNINNKLKITNKELESFVYIVSHDLKAPARQISMFSDMVLSCNDEEQKRVFLEKIKQTSNKMQNLIDDLLSFSLVSKNHNIKDISILDSINNVINTLDVDIKSNNVKIEIFGNDFIKIDKTHLEQMFINLISNSIKFRREDVDPIIKITIKNESNKICIIVEDNGIGFDNKYNKKIFEIFNRIYTNEKYEGTGIGLAICKKIAERYNWEIHADGDLGHGSRFTISIPERV